MAARSGNAIADPPQVDAGPTTETH
jgi:hypothetical protein